jgi:hypothetical protein
MTMRFRALTTASTFTALALALAACSDSPTSVRPFPVTVQVEYPATYAEAPAAGAKVVLRSVERGHADTLTTDAAGKVTFPDMVPGTYEITASRALTEEEAFRLTGNRVEAHLNARLASERLDEHAASLVLQLAGAPLGAFIIKEVYYTGSERPSGGTYFFDQFVEIYNNSTDTLYAGGLMLAFVHGPAGQISPSTQPTPFQADHENVYADAVWRIPGKATDHPVAPGGSILIAQQGLNHKSDANGNPNSPVDLGNADWEMYVDVPDSRDIDSPTVPNMEMLQHRSGFYALMPVFGPGLVLFRADDFAALERVAIPGSSPDSPPVIKIPVATVIDAFEALQNANSGPFKRIPAALNAGFVYASGTYTAESARRRVEKTIAGRKVLKNTNDAGADFEIVARPTPRGF